MASDFLAGGGEMGAVIRAYDWDNSPLGPPEHWQQSLRVVVRLMLDSRHPMLIWWGPELIQFYNDLLDLCAAKGFYQRPLLHSWLQSFGECTPPGVLSSCPWLR